MDEIKIKWLFIKYYFNRISTNPDVDKNYLVQKYILVSLKEVIVIV